MTIKPWKHINTVTCYRGNILKVEKTKARSCESGREHDFDILVCPDWVNIVALTPEENVVFVKQYRHGTREVTLEIPGGQIDPGEQPLEAAKRELLEETGYKADSWELIGTVLPNPAFQTNKTYTFLARTSLKKEPPKPDETEEIEVQEEELSSIPSLIKQGTINHALVLCAFFYFYINDGIDLVERSLKL